MNVSQCRISAAIAFFEEKRLNFGKRHFAYLSGAVRRAVDSIIVHQNVLTVFGTLNVKLDDINAGFNAGLDRFERC